MNNPSYSNDPGTPQERNPHYIKNGGFDAWYILNQKFTREQYEGYFIGNILKYLIRYQHKGTPLQDLKKIRDHVDVLISLYEELPMKGGE